MAYTTDNFQVEGFVEQRKELESLMMSNPAMEKKVQGLIRKVLAEVRRTMQGAAKGEINSDPRQSYKAVRMAVYKRILGGNANILSSSRAKSNGAAYTPTRTLRTGQRGGNRRDRSHRSMMLESYTGAARGFVLRFLNAGTDNRGVKYEYNDSRRVDKWNKHPNTGFRGRITPRNFFGNRSHREMENAAKNLETLIDNLIKQELQ